MKLPHVLFLILGGPMLTAASAGPSGPGSADGTSAVMVVVSDLPSTSSAVKLYFYKVRDTFLKPNQYAFRKVVRPDGHNQISLPVDLENGDWAVAITQDTNNNDKLDKNMIGIPTEPYAFSNNVRPKLSPPDFNDCKFTVSGPGKVITIALVK